MYLQFNWEETRGECLRVRTRVSCSSVPQIEAISSKPTQHLCQSLVQMLVFGLVSVVMMETAAAKRWRACPVVLWHTWIVNHLNLHASWSFSSENEVDIKLTASLKRAPAVTSGGAEVSARARFVLVLFHNGKQTCQSHFSKPKLVKGKNLNEELLENGLFVLLWNTIWKICTTGASFIGGRAKFSSKVTKNVLLHLY